MRLWIIAVAMSASCSCAAQMDPFVGPNRFPEYRNLSGLSGGAYGLDRNGRASLSGPAAFSTPIAHVLGHSQIRLHVATASFNARPELHKDRSNGTLVPSYGHTFGRYNVMITEMLLADPAERATNLQVQIPTATASRLALSAGVQGLFGAAKSHGVFEELERDSRSGFACATYELPTGRQSLFITGGLGTRRFRQGFLSASMRVASPLRIWLEHDGYGLNQGVLFASQRKVGGRIFEWTLSGGYLQGRYFTFATGIGF